LTRSKRVPSVPINRTFVALVPAGPDRTVVCAAAEAEPVVEDEQPETGTPSGESA
jgi:hypothetical protein